MSAAQAPVLLCSHGTSSPAGQRAVAALAAAVREAGTGTVAEAFVDVQQPDVPTALAALTGGGGEPAVVVPLLLSAGFHVYVDLTEAVAGEPATLTAALGPDPRLVEVLRRRLQQAGLAEADRVVLAAAGSSDARAVRDCHRTAEQLAAALGRPVRIGFLSAARPTLAEAVAKARSDGGRVAVATYLLAPGYFHDLVLGCGAEVVADPLLVADAAVPAELVAVVLDRAAGARPVSD